ncbi:MAG: AAA family ATPase [Treponema sp.]|nr:AAA family ATPase [Treponema sp.]
MVILYILLIAGLFFGIWKLSVYVEKKYTPDSENTHKTESIQSEDKDEKNILIQITQYSELIDLIVDKTKNNINIKELINKCYQHFNLKPDEIPFSELLHSSLYCFFYESFIFNLQKYIKNEINTDIFFEKYFSISSTKRAKEEKLKNKDKIFLDVFNCIIKISLLIDDDFSKEINNNIKILKKQQIPYQLFIIIIGIYGKYKEFVDYNDENNNYDVLMAEISKFLSKCNHEQFNEDEYDKDIIGIINLHETKQEMEIACLYSLLKVINETYRLSLSSKQLANEYFEDYIPKNDLIHDLRKNKLLTVDERQILLFLEMRLANEMENEQELKTALNELDSIIGLAKVKEEITTLTNYVRVRELRKKMGLKEEPLSLHLVFLGNPGTGKTTIARIIAKIYKSLGILSRGHLVETDRSGLVAGFVGQTALKTQEIIKSALGGVLFIDEAYSLYKNDIRNDFGQEAIETLLKAMEDYRDDFIVIVAGYPDLMQQFLKSNPGLESRFNTKIYFEDYTPLELFEILLEISKKSGYIISEKAYSKIKEYFEKIYSFRDDTYANGRTVRNFFENARKKQINRIALINNPSKSELQELLEEDFF